MSIGDTFQGEIVVASRIVDYLSSGLYESPAACLKELINNSYDADASRVQVFVKPDADRIIIADDGHGLNKSDFIRHFSRISESHKRDDTDTTKSGRPKIGKIGIGFIAANEICDVMEIYSTKSGSRELLHASINFSKMREDPDIRRRDQQDFAKGDYEGEVLDTDAYSHYTQIFLKHVRGEAQNILAGAKVGAHTAGERSLYGLSEGTVLHELQDSNLKSWSQFDSYSQNLLQIGLNVPVRYFDGWIPGKLQAPLENIVETTDSLGFHVSIDGTELHKPIVFSPGDKRSLVRPFKFEGSHVSASGYFYAQHGAIKPQELQGLLLRIRHAAIGKYDSTFLGFDPSEGPLFQSWISAEIWADDRLEEAMNIDRRTLRVAHPAFVELQESIHEYLSALLTEVRAKLYGEGSKQRKSLQARQSANMIAGVAEKKLALVAPQVAEDLKVHWTEVADSDPGSKRLLRKFSVAQLYEIIVEIAQDLLPPETFREFIRRLTERLSK